MDCVRDNRSRPGFEYRYCFETTDRDQTLSGGDSRFVFEFRTKFILKSREEDDEKVLGSQSFEASIDGGNCDEGFVVCLRMKAGLRLQEYWMPIDLTQKLYHDALDLARSMVGPPREIPIVVWVDVCTVQRAGEELEEAMDRAITEEKLLPYELFVGECTDIDEDFSEFLAWKLPRIRVEDVEQGMGLMESCPLCQRGPTIGAQITLAPTPCGHAFHSHCIVGWMRRNKSKSCPLLCLDDDKSH